MNDIRSSPTPAGTREAPGSVRFVHSADWQLGMTRHFLSAEAQARFSQARIDAIRTIGTIARADRAAFVVVSGDVFETNQVDPRTVRRALEALGTVPVPVFLLPGNHDPLDAASVFRSQTFTGGKPAHVTVLEDSTPHAVPGLAGVEVIGAPWTSKRPLRDLVAAVADELPTGPGTMRILVAHGSTDEMIELDNPAVIRVAAAEAALRDGRLAYIALGDRHSTTQVGSTNGIWYAGAPEPTDYDETDAGNVLLVEIDGRGARTVERRRTGTWQFRREAFEVGGRAGLEDLARFLEALEPKERAIVKLTLVGTLSLSENAALHDLLEHSRDLLGGLEEWERHKDLVVVPDDEDFAGMALTGFAAETVTILRARAAADGAEADVARDALALLVRLAAPVGGAR